jgi:hypothetical protein
MARDLSEARGIAGMPDMDEAHLLRRMTIRESLERWLALQACFEDQLRQTETIFGPERRASLALLQARLRRLPAGEAR